MNIRLTNIFVCVKNFSTSAVSTKGLITRDRQHGEQRKSRYQTCTYGKVTVSAFDRALMKWKKEERKEKNRIWSLAASICLWKQNMLEKERRTVGEAGRVRGADKRNRAESCYVESWKWRRIPPLHMSHDRLQAAIKYLLLDFFLLRFHLFA